MGYRIADYVLSFSGSFVLALTFAILLAAAGAGCAVGLALRWAQKHWQGENWERNHE